MAWLYLVIAGLLEVVWAIGMKQLGKLWNWWIGTGTLAAMLLSFYFLALALRTLPVGTAYAVWTGIGAVGVAVLGIIVFQESSSPTRLLFLALIVIGIIGLKFSNK